MRTFSLDDGAVVFAFRGATFLALLFLLVHSPRLEAAFRWGPFALAGAYLATSLALWRLRDPRLRAPAAQAAAFLWDVAVVSAVLYSSEGFDGELYLMYFLIMFMSGLMSRVGQSFLIAAVASLIYAALWAQGKAAAGLPLVNLLLRFAFLFAAAFLAAVLAARVRDRDRRARSLELRLALGKLANGGWGLAADEEPALDPELAKTVRTVNALIDNLARALRKTVSQNEELREAADAALLQLAHERERLGAAVAKSQRPS